MPQRIYVYKCVYDEGGAPCVDGGRLSLTICKPQIRSSAQVGDLIFAFGSNSESPPDRLIYVARVTQRIGSGEYFKDPEFRSRGDCIYTRQPNGVFVLRRGAKYHADADHRLRDLGPAPGYRRAIALVSDDFRYFGGEGTDEWKAMAPNLRKMVEKLGQGHRVNHTSPVRDELLALEDFVRRAYRRKINGKPLHAEEHLAKCGTCKPIDRKNRSGIC